jgi:uncharacterized protein (TIGR02270 family)
MAEIARVVWEVAETHLDEAEFLARTFEQDLDTPTSTLLEVGAGIEERLLAHVAGLVILGQPGVERVLEPALKDGPSERTKAAALARLSSTHDDGLEALWPWALEAENKAPLFRALALAERITDERIVALLGQNAPSIDAALLHVLALRGVSLGDQLADALASQDEGVVTAAFEVARFAAPGLAKQALRQAPGQPSSLAPLIVGVQLGSPAAWQQVRALASEPGKLQRGAMELLAVGGQADDQALLLELFGDGASAANALWALGFLGTREVLELCLAHLAHPKLGGLAAEALCATTGLDPRAEKLLAPRPLAPDGLPPLEEDDLDADLVPKPEDELPRLEPEATARWWKKHAQRFSGFGRALYGQPFQRASLPAALDQASTRRRHVLALELAVASKGTSQVATWAATARQFEQLERVSTTATGRA